MTARVLRWSAIAVCVTGGVVAWFWGWWLDGQNAVLFPFLAYAAMGWFLTTRRPENAVGWVFLSVGVIVGLFGLAEWGSWQALQRGDPTVWWGVAGAWGVNWLYVPLLTMSTTIPLLLFPSGSPSRSGRWVGASAVVFGVVASLCGIVSPVLTLPDSRYPPVRNPLSPGFMSSWQQASDYWPIRNLSLLGVTVTALLAAVGIFVRARRARGAEKLQLHWVAFGATLMAGFLVLDPFVLSDPRLATLNNFLYAAALALLPISMGIAILRYRLYDIDRIVSRTTSYAIVTGCLIATFVLIVGLVSHLFPAQSSLGVASATLATAGLARPVFRRVQVGVDRRFNRSSFDAQQTVEAFSSRLRHQVGSQHVSEDLISAVNDTLQPETVGLWLRTTPVPAPD